MTTTLDDITQQHLDTLTDLVEQSRHKMILDGSRRYPLSPDLVEDCVQTAYIKVARVVRDGELKEGGNLRSYLWSAFYRACLDSLRSQRRTRHCSLSSYDSPLPSTTPTPLATAVTAETVATIEQATTEVPSAYHEAFQLRIFGQVDYATIAQRVGVKLKTARVQIHKARVYLQKRLQHILHS